MKPVYMAVTKDRFELPVAVADSPYELARLLGISVYPILHAVAEHRKNSKYLRIWIEEDEWKAD